MCQCLSQWQWRLVREITGSGWLHSESKRKLSISATEHPLAASAECETAPYGYELRHRPSLFSARCMTNVADCLLSWAVFRKVHGKVINHRYQLLLRQTGAGLMGTDCGRPLSQWQVASFLSVKRNYVFSPSGLYWISLLMMWTQANCTGSASLLVTHCCLHVVCNVRSNTGTASHYSVF